MAKIDDRTVNLHKTRDGEFSEPAQRLAYCPDAAQRGYAESAKPKWCFTRWCSDKSGGRG
jgi:hypothetical protein